MVKNMNQKELRDVKFGNTKSKVVAFHKGKNNIHEADREKVSSIIANLNSENIEKRQASYKEQKKLKMKEMPINLDETSLRKLG